MDTSLEAQDGGLVVPRSRPRKTFLKDGACSAVSRLPCNAIVCVRECVL